jgi:serine/threonine-protein kinase
MAAAKTFGNYTLLSKLASGGMGETHLAEQLGAAGVSRQVVIKLMLPRFADNQAIVDAFVQEARVSTTLTHGNIAQVYEFGEVDGRYFLAMEHVSGRSLQKVLERVKESGFRRLPFAVSAYVTIELLKALHYAHTRTGADGRPLNLVHRDVSPDNVMIGFEGEVKLVDFGVAKASMKDRAETEPGLVKGKYCYLSPEQAQADPLDGRSDLFSAGILLYEMLTGTRPFPGAGQAAMREIVFADVVPPRVRVAGVPEELGQIAMKALQKKREDRFSTARAMQEALSRWLYGQAPDFSGEVLRELMGELFADELLAEGHRFLPHEHATRVLRVLQTHDTAHDVSSPLAAVPRRRRPWRALAFVVLAASAAGGAALGARIALTPPPPTVEQCLCFYPAFSGPTDPSDVKMFVRDCLRRPPEPREEKAVQDETCRMQLHSLASAREALKKGLAQEALRWLALDPLPCVRDQYDDLRQRALKASPAQPVVLAPPAPPPPPPDPAPNPDLEAAVPPSATQSPPLTPQQQQAQSLLEEARTDMKLRTEAGYKAAKAKLDKCVRIDKTAFDCHKLLGAALGQLGDAPGGAREYELFLKYAPPDHLQLGHVKELLQQYYDTGRKR